MATEAHGCLPKGHWPTLGFQMANGELKIQNVPRTIQKELKHFQRRFRHPVASSGHWERTKVLVPLAIRKEPSVIQRLPTVALKKSSGYN